MGPDRHDARVGRAVLAVRRLGRRLGEDAVRRVRTRGRSAVVRASRLTGAAVAAYVVATELNTSPQPLIAALTALIVVQATLFSTMTYGLQRVVSVVAGVAFAVVFSSAVGLTWWSLGILIAACVVLGQLLRLGQHLVEVPISGMLVLSVGAAGAEVVAAGRILETLVGAAVGVLVNVAFPPAVQLRHAGAAVERFAADLAGLLETAAREMAAGGTADQALRWLEDARRLNRHVPRVDRALAHTEESRQLNPRALARPDRGPSLRGALEALEHCSVALRSLFRSMHDAARARADQDKDYDADVREAFSLLLRELATTLRFFGLLVRAEAAGSGGEMEAAGTALAAALEELRDARARVTELLLVMDPRDDPALWEVNSALLATVERVLRELDVEQHARLRERGRSSAAERAEYAMERLRTTSRQLAERPRRRAN